MLATHSAIDGAPTASPATAVTPEFGELIGIGAGARPNTHHPINHINRGNGNHALLGFSQGGEGIIPTASSESEYWSKVQHHGPRDGHDVVFTSVSSSHGDHWPGLNQRKGPAQFHLSHTGVLQNALKAHRQMGSLRCCRRQISLRSREGLKKANYLRSGG
jgi:hypothetical protein